VNRAARRRDESTPCDEETRSVPQAMKLPAQEDWRTPNDPDFKPLLPMYALTAAAKNLQGDTALPPKSM
jgi:hypothetical protein